MIEREVARIIPHACLVAIASPIVVWIITTFIDPEDVRFPRVPQWVGGPWRWRPPAAPLGVCRRWIERTRAKQFTRGLAARERS